MSLRPLLLDCGIEKCKANIGNKTTTAIKKNHFITTNMKTKWEKKSVRTFVCDDQKKKKRRKKFHTGKKGNDFFFINYC